MAKHSACLLRDIDFDLRPLIVLAADAFTTRADGDEPAQNLGEGFTEGLLERVCFLFRANTLQEESLLLSIPYTLHPEGNANEIEQQRETEYLEEMGSYLSFSNVGVNWSLSSAEDVQGVQET